jgi:hypothetical protein
MVYARGSRCKPNERHSVISFGDVRVDRRSDRLSDPGGLREDETCVSGFEYFAKTAYALPRG